MEKTYKIGLSNSDKDKMRNEVKELILGEVRKIYSVKFYGSSAAGVRADDAVGMVANVGINDGLVVQNDFDSAPIYSQIVPIEEPARDSSGNILTGTDGKTIYNRLIQVPNFYFRYLEATDTTGDFVEFSITDSPMAGFNRIFKNSDGTEPQYIYLSAFKTTILDNGSTTLLGCQKGQLPYVNATLNNMNALMSYVKDDVRDIPLTKLCGGELLEYWDIRAILMTIEFATRNIQTIMKGIVSDWYIPGNDSNNVLSTNCNYLYVLASNAGFASLVVGDTLSIFNRSGSMSYNTWGQHKITAIEANTPSSGYTKITFDGDAVQWKADWSYGCSLAVGTPVGSTDSVVASSGSVGSNTNAYSHFKYRGFEDCYGEFWENIQNYGNKFVRDSDGNDVIHPVSFNKSTSSYNDLTTWDVLSDFSLPNSADTWLKNIYVSNNLIFPKELIASETTYYSDYNYSHRQDTAGTWYGTLYAGGVGSDGGSDGPFCFGGNGGWGSAGFYWGFRPSLWL